MNKISIIIPSYNYGQYISQALLSLQNQSYNNWECIVVDDGSTDDTKQKVEEWIKKDQRIKYFSQQNAGPAIARNYGITQSKGEYILFLDADDLIESDKLKSHVDVLKKNNEVDIAYGDARYFMDGKPDELFCSLKRENKPWIKKYSGKGHGLINTLIRQNIMVISSPLIRKKVLAEAGLFDTKLLKLEDWELFQRWAINDFIFQYVDAPQSLVLVRAHEKSFSYDEKGMQSYFLPIAEKQFSNNKLNFKDRIHLFLRMVEEYTDLAINFIINSSYKPRHYYKIYKFILPVICILLLPVYLVIKIFRVLRKLFQNG